MSSLAAQSSQQGIRFVAADEFGEYLFEEPRPLSLWSPLAEKGLYAILVYDNTCKPKPYRVIYFGQTDDFSQRGLLTHHEKYQDWVREANRSTPGLLGGSGLYVATLEVPFSTEDLRKNMVETLVKKYQPVCHVRSDSLSDTN